ncbi:Carboxylesterase [Thalictrum thalictroides]|uniref:Carboxylesterase n=1 Tax=Thalictrum thalictroides TaxID=46969 RepID=A0A7J6VVY9_THATH|nr:Carboxylesterase [Thalictrum thalictroides]
MADQYPNVIPIDPFKALNIILNPNGTLTRDFVRVLPSTIPNSDSNQSVVFTDIPLNPSKNTYVRVFRPALLPSSHPKLPLIIFFHGGGFILFSASSKMFHDFCVHMAFELPALILSIEHRLCPEYRLPSAYEDALDAILWVKNHHALKGEYKFFEFVDFSKCFIMGMSSGANITYQTGLETTNLNLEPIKIIGLIMVQPFFGGVQRSDSELRLANDKLIPIPVTDMMWELALPIGANRDHEYSNPLDERTHSKNMENIKKFPRCYVTGNFEDPLIDRQIKFVKMLEEDGVCVMKDFTNGYHACELFDPTKAQELVVGIKNFISSCSTTP